MRTTFFILTLFCIMGFSCKAQHDTLISDSVITESEMSDAAWKNWFSLDTTWTNNIFPNCLSENNLRLRCDGCEKIYLTVQMKIDSTGKLISYKKIKENMCGKDFLITLEKCFFDFFFFIEFPGEFRNTTIEVRLGNGLKC